MPIFLPALSAFFITVLITPLTIYMAKRYGLVDDPNKKPHPAQLSHRIIPKAGGIPIFLGIILPTIFFIPLDKHIIGIIIAVFLLIISGLLDDILHDFSPFKRLLLQFLSAAIVVSAGVGITFITSPFGGILRLDSLVIPFNFLGSHNIIIIADLFALVWIVWMINMVNWSWGVDGQMPGIIAIAAILIGFVAFNLYLKGDPNQLPLSILSFITAGSALGFLVFNWHPAKIFPGDSGSNILGFMIAVLCILSSAKLAIALLVLLVPATDFFYTIIRRVLSKKSPFFGDNKHLHHLLIKRGWSHRKISLFYIISCAILGLLAINLSSSEKIFTIISVGILVAGIILWLNFFGKQSEH